MKSSGRLIFLFISTFSLGCNYCDFFETECNLSKLKSGNKEDVISGIRYFNDLMNREFLPNVITTYYENTSPEIKLESLEASVTIGALEILRDTLQVREFKISEIDTSIYCFETYG